MIAQTAASPGAYATSTPGDCTATIGISARSGGSYAAVGRVLVGRGGSVRQRQSEQRADRLGGGWPREQVALAVLAADRLESRPTPSWEHVMVEDVLWDDGRVVGVRGWRDGQPFEARASLVIGAEGQHSLIARKVEADVVQSTLPMTFGYCTYWENMPLGGPPA